MDDEYNDGSLREGSGGGGEAWKIMLKHTTPIPGVSIIMENYTE